MKKLLLLTLISILTLASCATQNSENKDLKLKAVINLEMAFENLSNDFSSEIDSCWYVTLKSPNEKLIGEVTKVIKHKDKLFVLDSWVAAKVNVYTLNGDYIGSLSNKGSAAHEYVFASDIDIHNNYVVLLDHTSREILYFDIETLSFIKKIKLDKMITSFTQLESGDIFGTLSSYAKYDAGNHILLKTDSLVQNPEYLLPLDEYIGQGAYMTLREKPFTHKRDDSALFYTLIYDYIYKLGDNGIEPEYGLDFGKFTIPYEQRINGDSFEKWSKQNECAYLASAPVATDNSILFKIAKGENFYISLYNIETGKLTTIKTLPSNVDITTPYQPVGECKGNIIISEVPTYVSDLIKQNGDTLPYEESITSTTLMFTCYK